MVLQIHLNNGAFDDYLAIINAFKMSIFNLFVDVVEYEAVAIVFCHRNRIVSYVVYDI